MISRIKGGDVDCFEDLLKIHHRMIYKIVYDYDLENGDFAMDAKDLYQEGCLALYEACFSFDESRNVRFSSYAYMRIRSRIQSKLRDYYRRHREMVYSLDNLTDHAMMSCVSDNASRYHREAEFREVYEHFLATLSPEDAQILEMRKEENSYREIAERLNITTKRVDNRLSHIRQELRKDLNRQQRELDRLDMNGK